MLCTYIIHVAIYVYVCKMFSHTWNQYDIFEAAYSVVHYFNEMMQMKVICIIK